MTTLHKSVLGVVLLLALLVQSWRLHRAWEEARSIAFVADSIRAANDSTRELSEREKKALGDSLTGVRKLVVQTTQRADALDRALKAERKARLEATVSLPTLDTALVGAVRDSGDVRVGRFESHSPPFQVRAVVALPPPPEPGQMALRVVVDPIPVGMRLACGVKGVGGVRSAEVVMTGPQWAVFDIGQVTQAREICNPRVSVPLGQKAKYAAMGAGILALARFLLGG